MKRFHHLRIDEETRDRLAEVKVTAEDLIYPYFVVPGSGKKEIIKLPLKIILYLLI